ncbi:hypothetical protein NDS46_30100 (plasmid) [Paenibacillus thiaminolyticus]|uniref:hypothetical protein n=1 Tax=Paenibacillus thiaminolyticus TaxID=49283 RepID=UPI00232D7D22|nr:hypothetical protein [Paenibacillus thiaminolyticus]WCF11600.1 hypothetical protein NDS46_30100 [Paenibacillus thiaminolyticus]
MIKLDASEVIPKPLLWTCVFMMTIFLLPIGLAYCLFCLIQARRHRSDFHLTSYFIIYSILTPGYYTGLVLSGAIVAFTCFPKSFPEIRNQKKKQKRLRNKRHQCKEWLKQFPFIQSEMSEVIVYISKEEAVGRIILRNVTEEEKGIIERQKTSLPAHIHLEVHNLRMSEAVI